MKQPTSPVERSSDSEERYRLLAETTRDIIVVHNVEGRITYVNRAGLEFSGFSEEDALGRPVTDFVPAERVGEVVAYQARRTAGDMSTFRYDTEFVNRAGQRVPIEITSTPILHDDRAEEILVVARDISDRVNVEQMLRQKTDNLAMLIGVSSAWISYHEMGALLQKIAEDTGHLAGMVSAAIYFLRDDTLHLEATSPALPPGMPEELRRAPLSDHPYIQRALSTTSPVIVPDTRSADLTPAEMVAIELRNLRSLLFLPLGYQGNAIGVLIVGSVGETHHFSDDEVSVYQALATQASLQIQETRLHEVNQKIIADLQQEIAVRVQVEEALQATLDQADAARVALLSILEDQRQVEANLRESRLQFRTLFEANPLGIGLYGADGRFRRGNPAMLDLLGYAADELATIDPTHPDDRDAGKDLFDKLVAGEIDHYEREKRYLRRDGQVIWVQITASCIQSADDELPYVMLVNQDITARKQTEEAVDRQTRELQILYQASRQLRRTLDLEHIYPTIHQFVRRSIPCDNLFISTYDAETQLITCYAAWNGDIRLDVSAFPPIPLEPEGHGIQSGAIRSGQPLLINDIEAYLNHTHTRYYVDEQSVLYNEVPDDTPRTRAALVVPLVVEDQVTGVFQVFSDHLNAYRSEHLRLLESLAAHIASALQNAALYQAAQREIAERKLAEEKLLESETMLRLIFDNASDGINVYEEDPATRSRRLVDCNERYAEMAGCSRAELLAAGSTRGMQVNLGPQRTPEENRKLRRERLPYWGTVSWLRPDNKDNVIEYIAVPVQMGDRLLTIGIDRDITDRIRAKETLQAYADRLEDLVAERTRELEAAHERLLRQARLATLGQIAGSIAHELRTPLGAIKNAAYLVGMLVQVNDDVLRETLDILTEAVHTSDHIITTLLNFARPQRPHRQLVEVGEVVESAVQRLQLTPDVQLEMAIAADLPLVIADATHLEQAFGNLLMNAIQAMPGGGRLTIRVSQRATLPDFAPPGFAPERHDAAAAGWVSVTVADTGVGIPPENLPHLFEPLFTTKSTGIGLGLALVRLFIEATGGGVAVVSAPGQGTEFEVCLPSAEVA